MQNVKRIAREKSSRSTKISAAQSQITIPGTDTELSRACDEYENAHSNLEKAKNSLDLAIEELIPTMKKHGKTSIQLDHGGKIVLRAGRITHDVIVFKKSA